MCSIVSPAGIKIGECGKDIILIRTVFYFRAVPEIENDYVREKAEAPNDFMMTLQDGRYKRFCTLI